MTKKEAFFPQSAALQGGATSRPEALAPELQHECWRKLHKPGLSCELGTTWAGLQILVKLSRCHVTLRVSPASLCLASTHAPKHHGTKEAMLEAPGMVPGTQQLQHVLCVITQAPLNQCVLNLGSWALRKRSTGIIAKMKACSTAQPVGDK